MPNALDLSGVRFGSLVAIERNGNNKHRQTVWRCECDCGNTCDALLMSLRKGHKTSCGCKSSRRDIGSLNRRHGMSHTPIFAIWNSMKQRCLNPNNHAYARYGGRGVTVCERWQVFENFYADMGDKPEGMSLERVDNDRGYEPGNVVWATAKQQNRNRRSSAIINFDGVLATVAEWSEITGIKPATLSQRIRLGWDVKRALTEPAIRRGQHA